MQDVTSLMSLINLVKFYRALKRDIALFCITEYKGEKHNFSEYIRYYRCR